MNAVEAVDPDEYDRISLEDFESWLTDGGNPRGIGLTDGKPFGLGLAPLARPDEEQPDGDTQHLRGFAEQPYAPALWGIQLKRHGHSMMRARKLLCLDCFNINDLMEMLAEVEVEVSLERATMKMLYVSGCGTSTCLYEGIRTYRILFGCDCFRFRRGWPSKAAKCHLQVSYQHSLCPRGSPLG